MDNLFVRSIVTERVKLQPHELRRGYEASILRQLKSAHEGRCTRNGYIRRGSIRIVKVSEGRLDTNSLNGSVQFVAVFECDACTPVKGDAVTATVRNFNRFGVMASVGIPDAREESEGDVADTKRASVTTPVPVMSIIIPKQSASGSLNSAIDLNAVAVGDRLVTEIVNVKYELNDPRISTLGRALRKMEGVGDEARDTEPDVSYKKDERKAAVDRTQEVVAPRRKRDSLTGDEIYVAEEDEDDPEEAAETSVAAALEEEDYGDDDGDDDRSGQEGHNKSRSKSKGKSLSKSQGKGKSQSRSEEAPRRRSGYEFEEDENEDEEGEEGEDRDDNEAEAEAAANEVEDDDFGDGFGAGEDDEDGDGEEDEAEDDAAASAAKQQKANTSSPPSSKAAVDPAKQTGNEGQRPSPGGKRSGSGTKSGPKKEAKSSTTKPTESTRRKR